ncbi:HAD family hydrolase [Kitasatospora sp. LaBMicrA B282]|uniref:HAD family hydrolase n=1 Tax=Kitasatospora sp. LaBMicrA B282 TaxID=3420949 RepID=UPI003D12E566
MARPAAFLDVDGTLLRGVSLFRFLAHDLRRRGLGPAAFEAAMAENRRLKALGTPREEVNRAFYRQFAGREVGELARHGEQWWAEEERGGGLLDPLVLAAVRRHQAAGEPVVLVSGSFPPCLDPIARRTDATTVLCTRPAIRDGRYTGAVAHPMIGARKVHAIEELATLLDLDLTRSHAYGDHASDLPMLEAVGHPVVVGPDPDLHRTAAARGWARLDRSTPEPGRPTPERE